MKRRVTNVDPGGRQQSGKVRKGGPRKGIWWEDSYEERFEDDGVTPSRYGPRREYIANCESEEVASRFVELWNAALEGK